MHACSFTLALPWMFFMASGSLNSNICNYEPPEFPATSGPINITILTPKTPQEIRMPDVYMNWLIANGSCISEETGKPDFPCPMTCEPEFCWLTLQIPEIRGVKKIHFISKEDNRTHLGSIVRSGNFFNVQSFFESDAPTVHCVSKETVTLSWTIQRPTKNARIRCTDGGVWRPTMSSDTHEVTVTYNLRHSEKNFEALYCSVDVGRSWVAANYFVVWQDTAKFVEVENSPKDTLAIAGNDRQHTLTWHVSTSESVTSKPFVCLDNNHLICSGVTLANDPGRCNIRGQDHSFQYSLAVDNLPNESTAYYCYIGGKVQAKSVLRSGVAIEDQLKAYIWYRVSGAKLILNNEKTHFLQVYNIRRNDVSCRALQESNKFGCLLKVENLQIYWMAMVDKWLRIVRTLSLNHPANFTGSVEQCLDESFEFTISDPVYDSSEVYSLLEHTGEIDASLLLRRILEGALQNSCKKDQQSRVSYNEDLEGTD